jgi:uncharacterized damage-inducible protein DinB
MKPTDYAMLMARYNCWMNEKLFALVGAMPAEELHRDRGAFFGSIFRTLDHIASADVIWLKRFSAALGAPEALAGVVAYPDIKSLGEPMNGSIEELCELRPFIDRAIEIWVATLDDEVLSSNISYRRLNGEAHTQPFFPLLMHFFNHQTHHRGQATTLFTQAGVEVGVTDLAVLVPEVPAAMP